MFEEIKSFGKRKYPNYKCIKDKDIYNIKVKEYWQYTLYVKIKCYLTNEKIITSISELKDILKYGKEDVFFTKKFSKSYMLSSKEFCHQLISLVLLYSSRRRGDLFLHDVGDRG